MAFSCGFYNSLNHDRLYNAIQHSSVFDGIITDGVLATIYQQFRVSAAGGMRVSIDTGRAWFDHTWTLNDAIILFDIPIADLLLPRIDAVVLNIDGRQQTRGNQPMVIQGTPSVNPQRPSMNSSDPLVKNYPLAYIYIGANQTVITTSNITNAVGTSQTPFAAGVLTGFDVDLFIAKLEQQWSDWENNTTAETDALLAAIEEELRRLNAGTEVMLKTTYAPDSQVTLDENNVSIISTYLHGSSSYFVEFIPMFNYTSNMSITIDGAAVALTDSEQRPIGSQIAWMSGDYVSIYRNGDVARLIQPQRSKMSIINYGNVENTRDYDKNVATARALTTGRSIQTNLSSSVGAVFNGVQNITPGVSGILPTTHGGTGRIDGYSAGLLSNKGDSAFGKYRLVFIEQSFTSQSNGVIGPFNLLGRPMSISGPYYEFLVSMGPVGLINILVEPFIGGTANSGVWYAILKNLTTGALLPNVNVYIYSMWLTQR